MSPIPGWAILVCVGVVVPQLVTAQGTWSSQGCQVDLCFVVDESGSIGLTNFQTVLDFLSEFVLLLDITSGGTRVGLVKFASSSELTIPLVQYSNAQVLSDALQNITYSSGGTSIAEGLRRARDDCFASTNGDRWNVGNVAVLLTDGQSDRQTASEQADLLRQTGASVVVIGIGSGVDNRSLLAIAGDPDNLFMVHDFQSLKADITQIVGRSCGEQEACLNAELSGWDISMYPVLNDCPRLSNPVIRDQKFEFQCVLNYTVDGSGRTPYFAVQFLFDNQTNAAVPERILTKPQTHAIMSENDMDASMLGKYIQCRVQTYWSNTLSQRSPALVSRSYWAGIAFSEEYLAVYEETPAPVLVYSTLPVLCAGVPPSNSEPCHLRLDIATSTGALVLYQRQDTAYTTCNYKVYGDAWDSAQSLTQDNERPLDLQVMSDVFVRPPTKTEVTLYVGDPGHAQKFWSGYQPSPLQVVAYNSLKYNTRITGDPQYSTFDGRWFTTASVGIFDVVLTNAGQNLQIQVEHFQCEAGRPSCSIACGVAVKYKDHTTILTSCPGSFHPIACPTTRSSDVEITSDKSMKKYMISTLDGVRVRVELLARGMNVFIRLPATYKNKGLRGLGGNYNGDPNDDVVDFFGDTVPVENFTRLYQVSQNRSLFTCLQPTKTGSSLQKDFCSCEPNINSCDKRAFESRLTNAGYPTAHVVQALVPAFLKTNSRARPRRSVSDGGRENTDDVDYTYDPRPSWNGNFDPTPPAWGTYNVSEAQAVEYCRSYLEGSPAYSVCGGVVSDGDFNVTMLKCVSDIQRSGDFTWAHNKIYEFQDICIESLFAQYNVTDTDNPTLDPAFTALLDSILDTLCPNNCSGSGVCSLGTCQCLPDYIGADCSLPRGTPPTVLQLVGPEACDAGAYLCQSVLLEALDLVASESLGCSISIHMDDGTRLTHRAAAELLTYSRVRCGLPDLLALSGAGSGPRQYRYTVTLTNDGHTYGAGGSSYRAVYSSEWVWPDCRQDNFYASKALTCYIDGQCYESGHNFSSCYRCDPAVNDDQWTHVCRPRVNPPRVNPPTPKPPSYGPWGPFGNCSKPCDFGLMTRNRACLIQGNCREQRLTGTSLCNEFSCTDDDDFEEEGLVLVFRQTDILQLVLVEDEILAVVAETLTNYSLSHKEQLCDAVNLKILDTPSDTRKVFQKDNVNVAKGYPAQNGTQRIRLKLVVDVYENKLGRVCDLTSEGRTKRALDTRSRAVRTDFVHSALTDNIQAIEEVLGLEISLSPGKEPGTEYPFDWMMTIVLPLGLVLLVALMATVIWYLCKRPLKWSKEKLRSSSAVLPHSPDDGSSGTSGSQSKVFPSVSSLRSNVKIAFETDSVTADSTAELTARECGLRFKGGASVSGMLSYLPKIGALGASENRDPVILTDVAGTEIDA